MEKRFKVVIDKKGNIQIETLEGFIGQECHQATEGIMQVLNGTLADSKEKDEFYMSDDPTQFLNLK